MPEASIPEKKYDVAISFLVQDLSLAQSLRDQLNESLEVFFFPHDQEDLAGTDGTESMRAPFLSESRVTVVVYRERWGQTPWTRIERLAIQDACLENGFDGLFFYMADDSAPPKWLPKTHVRFNASDFSLTQAVGAIKARVSEQGGRFEPMTPKKRALIYKQEEAYRLELAAFFSGGGLQRIHDAVDELFTALAAEATAHDFNGERGRIQMQNELPFVLSSATAGVIVTWYQEYINTLDNSALYLSEFAQPLVMPSQMAGRIYMKGPEPIKRTLLHPTITKSLHLVWEGFGKGPLSSKELADHIIIMLYDRMSAQAERNLRR